MRTTVQIPETVTDLLSSTSEAQRLPTPLQTHKGRPIKSFSDSSERSKTRLVKKIKDNYNQEALMLAAIRSLSDKKFTDQAYIVKQATQTTPTRGTKMRLALASTSTVQPYSPDEALDLVIRSGFSQRQYQSVRNRARAHGAKDLYPSYRKALEAKCRCYPEGINVTETSGEVPLQELLNHTFRRLSEVDDFHAPRQSTTLLMISKWGFDGTTGQCVYKQPFKENSSDICDEESLFISTLVPLRIENRVSKEIVWVNYVPSSTRFCWPIHFHFTKESNEATQAEEQYISHQIAALEPSVVQTPSGLVFHCQHILLLCMVDGKVINALTETSSNMRCYICGATPRHMNDLHYVTQLPTNKSSLNFGLSSLHAWIRFMEYFLHLAYRLKVQKWQSRKSSEKLMIVEEKKRIQAEFKKRLGLIVDAPRSGGSGNSNDGNTARRFFQQSKTSSEILRVPLILLERCHTILAVISSGHAIDIPKFKVFALETARACIDQYPWYYMPPSVHKVLVHGGDVIESMLLPIGSMSEEAQEARNKHFKSYRCDFARKISLTDTNRDLMNRLLCSSDPKIASLSRKRERKHKKLTEVMRSLLIPQFEESSNSESSESENGDPESDIE